jgi:hypothetical protein
LSPDPAPLSLEDYFAPEGEDRALLGLSSGGARLQRSRRSGSQRSLDHHALPGLQALDRTVFHVGPERISEHSRYDRAGGPNLHSSPMELPGRMRTGEEVEIGAARLRLRWAGRVRLELEGLGWERLAICLEARLGAQGRLQWLGQGLGELALGPLEGPFERWAMAWRSEEEGLLLPLPDRLWRAPLPELGPSSAPLPWTRDVLG